MARIAKRHSASGQRVLDFPGPKAPPASAKPLAYRLILEALAADVRLVRKLTDKSFDDMDRLRVARITVLTNLLGTMRLMHDEINFVRDPLEDLIKHAPNKLVRVLLNKARIAIYPETTK